MFTRDSASHLSTTALFIATGACMNPSSSSSRDGTLVFESHIAFAGVKFSQMKWHKISILWVENSYILSFSIYLLLCVCVCATVTVLTVSDILSANGSGMPLLVRVYPNNDLIFDVVGRKMGIVDTCRMDFFFHFIFLCVCVCLFENNRTKEKRGRNVML